MWEGIWMKAKTICKILIILLFFVVVFLLLLDLTCYSLRGTVIKSDKILVLSVDPSEEDFLNKHPVCETIHVQKPEIDRNIYEVGDRVIVKYDGKILDSSPSYIVAKSIKKQ